MVDVENRCTLESRACAMLEYRRRTRRLSRCQQLFLVRLATSIHRSVPFNSRIMEPPPFYLEPQL